MAMADGAVGAFVLGQAPPGGESGAAIVLIEGGGLAAAVAGFAVVACWGTRLPRDARMVLGGVLLLAIVTHLSAVVEWSTAIEMDQWVDLARVVTPILWMFFVYALAGELLRENLRREERRRTTMMRELDHRVKNNLTAVIAMAEQTLAWSKDLDDFTRSFLGRVRALGRAHEALAASRWEGTDLETIVRLTLAPYDGPPISDDETVVGERIAGGTPVPRVVVEGERVTLPARTSSAVCMTLHELATNAAKHGALSVPGGRVSVRWTTEAGVAAGGNGGRTGLVAATPGTVRLEWTEEGGPTVSPGCEGLGTGLIRGLVEYELGGRVELQMPRAGVQCVLEVPLGTEGEEFAVE